MPQGFKGSTALVVGGAGLIGSHIVDLLLGEGADEVRVLDSLVRGSKDNLARALADDRCLLLEGDIPDRDLVRRTVAGCDHVFHLAALRINLCAAHPRECIDVLVTGAFNVFEAAAETGVKKVVYSSSASVYGAAEAFPTTETHHPYNNRTLYGAAKLMNEGIARHFHDANGLASVGLRYFNVYGPRMDVTGAYTEVFIRWMDCVERGVPPQIHGDGSTSMDFVYVADVARANLLAMASGRADAVYNIASGVETTVIGLWRALQEATGAYRLSPEFRPAPKASPVPRRLAETRKAREELGFEARVALPEGLRRLVAWRNECKAREAVLA